MTIADSRGPPITTPSTGGLTPRKFTDIYDKSQFNYAAFPDGDHFLMIERDPRGDGRQVELILNWFQELAERVPVN